jgi:hypothetical protein
MNFQLEHDVQKKSRLIKLFFLITLTAVLVFYTAPSKYKYGDALVCSYWTFFVWWFFECVRQILPLTSSINFLKNEASRLLRIHSVFIIQTIFILCLWVIGVDIESEVLDKFLWGLAAYVSIFFIFTRFFGLNPALMIGSALVMAGLIHLCFMYIDIGTAYWEGRLHFFGDTRFVFIGENRLGLLEGIKDLPRVGRKYLSVAMINMIFGCLILAINSPMRKRYYYFVAAMGVIAIVLVDGRSAYVSIFSIIVISLIFNWRIVISRVSSIHLNGFRSFLLLCLIATIFLFAYESGKSRWDSMAYSFSKAYEHVYVSVEPVVQRPYVNIAFWSAPITNIQECFNNHEFRCEVDSSAYLRMAWLLEGMRQVVDHPFGVGGSHNYMGRLWGVEGVESKVQRVDSEFIMFAVSYGVFGLFFYLIMLSSAVMSMCGPLKTKLGLTAVFISSILVSILIRGMFDTISDGLWRCMMVLWGVHASIDYISTRFNRPFGVRNSLQSNCS